MVKGSIIVLVLMLGFVPQMAEAEDYIVMTPDKIPGWEAVGRVTRTLTGARETCTATLVAPDKVLTAAHCVSRQFGKAAAESPNLIFQAGKSGTFVVEVGRVVQIIYHPDYEPGTGLANVIPFDMAILRLEDALETVTPLPIEPLPSDEPVSFLGHRADGRNPPRLKTGCDWERVHPRVIEIACQAISGNSGAGIIIERNETKSLVAVISAAGDGNAYAALPDQWVMDQLANLAATN